MNRFRLLSAAFVALSLASGSAAHADTVNYADITGSTGTLVTGTVNGIGFTISGRTNFVNLSNTGQINYFTDNGQVSPGTVYVGGNISNAANDGGIVGISSANVTYTITFDSAVSNLVFSEVSLGDGGADVDYTFDQTFHVETCGTGWWGGGCFDGEPVGTNSNIMAGNESSGSVEFGETFTSLSFTVGPNSENWNGFDIGIRQASTTPAVPEPSSLALLGTGLIGLVGLARRKLRS